MYYVRSVRVMLKVVRKLSSSEKYNRVKCMHRFPVTTIWSSHNKYFIVKSQRISGKFFNEREVGWYYTYVNLTLILLPVSTYRDIVVRETRNGSFPSFLLSVRRNIHVPQYPWIRFCFQNITAFLRVSLKLKLRHRKIEFIAPIDI